MMRAVYAWGGWGAGAGAARAAGRGGAGGGSGSGSGVAGLIIGARHAKRLSVPCACPARIALRAGKPIRHEPVKAHMLFGGFTGKATVNLCRDTYHEPS